MSKAKYHWRFLSGAVLLVTLLAFVTTPAPEGVGAMQLKVDGSGLSGLNPDPPCFDSATRFVNCGNGTVTDRVTGLIWLANANCISSTNFSGANDSASALAEGQCSLTDGSRPGDWRLPTKEEWEALVDGSCPNAPKIVGNGLSGGCYTDNPWASGVQSLFYWSSTKILANTPDYAWEANLGLGRVDGFGERADDLFVWPVRGGQ